MPRLRTPLLALAAALAAAPPAAAQALNVVNVGARQLNCLFSPTCSVTVSDITAPYLGAGFLQSRVFQGQPGTVGAGKWVYEYRIDLRNVTGSPVPAVTSLSMPVAAPIVAMNFNGDHSANDQVFIITSGGLGSVGPSSAYLWGDTLHFNFATPVTGGASVGAGQTSFFFGFVSASPPTTVGARIESNVASDVFLEARGPEWAASGSAVPAGPGAPKPPAPPRPARPVRPSRP